MQQSGFRIRSIVASLLVVAQLAGALPAVAAPSAASGSAQLVSRAQGMYSQARYGEATTLLVGPVRRGELTGKALRNADVLIARCYVQTGNLARAKEYFSAALAVDPAFVLDKGHATPEEIDVFRDVRGSVAGPAMPSGTPAGGNGSTAPSGPPAPVAGAPKPASPPLHVPNASEGGPSWVSTHHALALLFAAGGVAAVAAIASSSSSSPAHKTGSLSTFPSVPERP